MKAKLLAGVGLAALLLVLPARGADVISIYDTIAGQKEHTFLFVAVKEAGEVATLKGTAKGTTKYTLFAPTDAAFKQLDGAAIDAIATDAKVVPRLVRAHLVPGVYTADDLRKLSGKELKTVAGVTLKIEDTKDGLRVGGAKITSADGGCSNGVIHVIDTVLPVPKE